MGFSFVLLGDGPSGHVRPCSSGMVTGGEYLVETGLSSIISLICSVSCSVQPMAFAPRWVDLAVT